MIAQHSAKGVPAPMRFKFREGDEETIIKVDRVIHMQPERIDKKNYIRYECSSIVDGLEKRYELKFEQEGLRWVLARM
jgi:uncharacterized protein (DUF1499 family)